MSKQKNIYNFSFLMREFSRRDNILAFFPLSLWILTSTKSGGAGSCIKPYELKFQRPSWLMKEIFLRKREFYIDENFTDCKEEKHTM